MKKLILSLGLVLPLAGFAQDNNELANLYFSKNLPELSAHDKLALNIAERFQQGDKTSKPFQSSDGSVSFVYGSGQIRVVCAPLQVCDIALQPGEVSVLTQFDGQFSMLNDGCIGVQKNTCYKGWGHKLPCPQPLNSLFYSHAVNGSLRHGLVLPSYACTN